MAPRAPECSGTPEGERAARFGEALGAAQHFQMPARP